MGKAQELNEEEIDDSAAQAILTQGSVWSVEGWDRKIARKTYNLLEQRWCLGMFNVPRLVAVRPCVLLLCTKPREPTSEPRGGGISPGGCMFSFSMRVRQWLQWRAGGVFRMGTEKGGGTVKPSFFPGDPSPGHKEGCCRRGWDAAGRSIGRTVPILTPKTF